MVNIKAPGSAWIQNKTDFYSDYIILGVKIEKWLLGRNKIQGAIKEDGFNFAKTPQKNLRKWHKKYRTLTKNLTSMSYKSFLLNSVNIWHNNWSLVGSSLLIWLISEVKIPKKLKF